MFKQTILFCTLACSMLSYAHNPFIAPLAYTTENQKIPVIASYTEETLVPEYAIKNKNNLQVINPKQDLINIDTTQIESATIANLNLYESGTYHIFTTLNYPLKYAYHQKEWKIWHDMTAEKAGDIAQRDYVIPSDFKKKPNLVDVQRHWLIQSFISKGAVSPVQMIQDYPLHVAFSTHPNQIKVGQTIHLTVHKNKQPILAEVEILAKGVKHESVSPVQTNALGEVPITFDKAGEYVISIHEPFSPQHKPMDQYYHITSIQVVD